MARKSRTKAELLAESEKLRARVAELEASEGPGLESGQRDLAERLPLIIFEVDAKGRLIYVNRRGLEATGYTAEEMRELEATRIVIPEDEPRLAEALGAVLRGETREGGEYTACRKDGSRVPIAVYTEPILEAGEVVGARGACIDISDRKRAEEALLVSEERFSKAFQLNPTLMVITRVEDGRIVEVNDVGLRTLGFEREEVIGRTTVELGLLEGSSRESIVRAIEDGQVRDVDVELRGKTGEVRHGVLSAQVLSTEADRYLLSMVSDITERRRAEDALRESETFLSSIYRSVETPIFVVDVGEDGVFRYAGANPAWEGLVGMTVPEIQGRAVEDLEPVWGGEVVAQARSDYEACLRAGKTVRAERRHAHRDREIWFLRSLTPVKDASGRHARIIGSIVDVTEIRKAQRRLRLFRDLLDHTNEAILLGDLDTGDLLDVNEAACRLTGFERSELLGMAIRDVSARIRDPAGEPSPPTPGEDTDSLEIEGTLERKDGGLVPVEASTRRVELEGQTYLVGIVRDASARRKAEQLRASLRRSETMSAMGRLVGGVAHEVRNPLFAISATLDTFEQHFAGSTEHEEYAELLRAEVDRMGVLMQDLLDYGRPPPARLSELPVQDVIRAAARSCTRSAEAADVTLQLDLPATPATLPMDQARLQQVFQNLVGNAIQHTPRGGRVRVFARAGKDVGEGGIVCTVEDSGTGFAWEDLPHLFEPFFTRRRGGTGLGLAIAQRIVEEHGGEIVAQNLPDGSGARLTVSFPSRAQRGEIGP